MSVKAGILYATKREDVMTQFNDTFEISVRCYGIAFCTVEAEITVTCEDDGCDGLTWYVERIEVENQTGTGWLRWDRKDIVGLVFFNQLGRAFFDAAERDEWIDAAATSHWLESQEDEGA